MGKKTAERMLLELKDRLADLDIAAPARVRAAPAASVAEAERALVALGYKAGEAARAAGSVEGEGLSPEQIVREALRRFASPERAS